VQGYDNQNQTNKVIHYLSHFTENHADMSSDSEEALGLLFLSPDHDHVSRVLEPSSCSGSDLFDYWPEANDTRASVYVALTMDALYSCNTHFLQE
jgi:hypothetical protein